MCRSPGAEIAKISKSNFRNKEKRSVFPKHCLQLRVLTCFVGGWTDPTVGPFWPKAAMCLLPSYISKSNDLPAKPANQPTRQPANPHTRSPSHPHTRHPASLSAMFTGGGKVRLTWQNGEKLMGFRLNAGRTFLCVFLNE